jgi:hypothetical protein
MGDMRSRSGILVGFAAAAGAFGAAAIMSAATAPTARADVYTDTIAAIDLDYSESQTAFDLASTDFSGNDVTAGLTAFFDGVNDDFLAAPENAYIGTVNALTNETFSGGFFYTITQPTDLADAEAIAQNDFTGGETSLAEAALALSDGNYGDAALLDSYGMNDVFILPLEQLLLGVTTSF